MLTGSMVYGHADHTASLMPNGDVRVVGGDWAPTGAQCYNAALGPAITQRRTLSVKSSVAWKLSSRVGLEPLSFVPRERCSCFWARETTRVGRQHASQCEQNARAPQGSFAGPVDASAGELSYGSWPSCFWAPGLASSFMSASTMISISSRNLTFGSQSRILFAFAGLPMSRSTSAGRS